MRVLHINCNYINSALHQNMIEGLKRLGIDNEVFVATYDRELTSIDVNDYVTIEECFNKWDKFIFDYKQRKIIEAIEQKYDIQSFDLIHAYTLFTDGNTAKVLSEKYNIPYIVAVRNTDVNYFFRLMRHLRKRGISILKQANKVLFLSHSYENQVFQKYIPHQIQNSILQKVMVVPNGIDYFWLDNKSDSRVFNKKDLKLIYVGRIDSNKNIGIIQKAVSRLISDGVECNLTVVGQIDDQKEFDKISKHPNTQFIPRQNKDELIKLYRNHDIFVMASFKESFGLVYAEAMSQGLPVIYTRGQGFDEQFHDGEVGYSVDPTSSEEIVRKIKDIIANYKDISSHCIYDVTKFDWRLICEKYKEVYSDEIRR